MLVTPVVSLRQKKQTRRRVHPIDITYVPAPEVDHKGMIYIFLDIVLCSVDGVKGI